ncbi:putative skeletal organic matrix protein 5 [Oculina patagonica]
MHSFLNLVRLILQLFCVIAIVTADGNNTAPMSTPAPSKKSEKAIIVNANGNSGSIEIANVKDSHNTEKAIKSLEATLEKNFQKLIRVVNATSRGKPNVESGSSFASCKDIYANHKSQGNRAYLLQINAGKVPVFCHMTIHGLGACGGGGWTLVMKIDGAKATFRYDSQL